MMGSVTRVMKAIPSVMIWASAAALLLVGCGPLDGGGRTGYGPDRQARKYLLTMELPTPQGVVTGRSTLDMRLQPHTDGTGQHRSVGISGSATPLYVGRKGVVIVLIESGRGWLLSAPWVDRSQEDLLEAGKVVDLDRSKYPDVLYFPDKSDPGTYRVMRGKDASYPLGPEGPNLSIRIRRYEGPYVDRDPYSYVEGLKARESAIKGKYGYFCADELIGSECIGEIFMKDHVR